MECPYCKNEMKHGSIDVDDTLSWTPDGERRKGPSRFTIARNGVLLARYYLLLSASCEASYCPDCKKIIIDLDK